MPVVTTLKFRTELNLTRAGSTLASRRYCALRKVILQKCREQRVTTKRQCREATWDELRTDADLPLIPLLSTSKKAAELHRAARMNSDDEDEDEAVTGTSITNREAVVRPPPTVYKEKPIQIIYIETSQAAPGTARQLP
ncbi:hypothetical protein HOY82DRAFT_614504 [Tuber indicum]|nr:hypothetical protein HOY82DRAFT_614504 [Tuber indicum]